VIGPHADLVGTVRADMEQVLLEDLFSDLYIAQSGGNPPSEEEYEVMKYIGELVRNQDAHLPMEEADVTKILNKASKTGGKNS
jgi:exonuclease SbcD